MANTYTQIYLQLVFSPLGHENVVPVKHKEELHKYITGIIQNRNINYWLLIVREIMFIYL